MLFHSQPMQKKEKKGVSRKCKQSFWGKSKIKICFLLKTKKKRKKTKLHRIQIWLHVYSFRGNNISCYSFDNCEHSSTSIYVYANHPQGLLYVQDKLQLNPVKNKQLMKLKIPRKRIRVPNFKYVELRKSSDHSYSIFARSHEWNTSFFSICLCRLERN